LLKYSGGNTFRLIRMAMDRALELSAGRPHLIKNASSEKETTIALEEISQGKIHYVKPESKVKAKGKS
jgi:DNA-directed RNA polymerase omega subunit